MKKLFIYILFCMAFYKVNAQQSVLFKIKYSPDKNYDSKVTIDMDGTANLSGDTAMLNKLQSQGITQPVSLKMEMGMNGNIKTGSAGTNHVFPVEIAYNFDHLNMTLNGNDIPVPTDKIKTSTIIYGHAGTDGKLKADSINGKSKDTSEKAVSHLLNSIQNQINFPDHPLKIGDTFTQGMPLSLPMGGNTIAADAKVVYKLTGISDGNAYFDIQQNLNVTIPVAGETVTLSGAGAGKLIYSIKDNFMTDYKSDITLKVSGKIKTLMIDATALMKMEYAYTIN